jgi:membrane-associated phospholipid phosphatase
MFLLSVLALVIPLSRLYFGVHMFTDVVAGAFLGVWVSLIVYGLYKDSFSRA